MATALTGEWQSGLERQLIVDLDAAPAGTRAVVLDVGANDGAWSRLWESEKRRLARDGKELRVILLEPQPQFHHTLAKMAAKCNFTYIQAAAADSDGTRAFVMQLGREASRRAHFEGDGDEQGMHASGRHATVRTVDLAALLHEVLDTQSRRRGLEASGHEATPQTLSLMKLDVESAEYELLPWLLAQGALCELRYAIIEWHLNMLAPEKRLSALGMRLAFHALVDAGCGSGRAKPAAVWHDDELVNNFAVPVPGLPRIAMEHGAWAGKASGGVDVSQMTTEFLHRDAAYLSSMDAQRVAAACDRSPRCLGGCRYEWLSCDANAIVEAYRRQMGHKVPVRDASDRRALAALDGAGQLHVCPLLLSPPRRTEAGRRPLEAVCSPRSGSHGPHRTVRSERPCP